jgi:hypothetical protein
MREAPQMRPVPKASAPADSRYDGMTTRSLPRERHRSPGRSVVRVVTEGSVFVDARRYLRQAPAGSDRRSLLGPGPTGVKSREQGPGSPRQKCLPTSSYGRADAVCFLFDFCVVDVVVS